jgi:hypothetical protein
VIKQLARLARISVVFPIRAIRTERTAKASTYILYVLVYHVPYDMAMWGLASFNEMMTQFGVWDGLSVRSSASFPRGRKEAAGRPDGRTHAARPLHATGSDSESAKTLDCLASGSRPLWWCMALGLHWLGCVRFFPGKMIMPIAENISVWPYG